MVREGRHSANSGCRLPGCRRWWSVDWRASWRRCGSVCSWQTPVVGAVQDRLVLASMEIDLSDTVDRGRQSRLRVLTRSCAQPPKSRIIQQHVDAFARNVHYPRDVAPRMPARIDEVEHRPLLHREFEKEILMRSSLAGFGEALLSARIRQTHDRNRHGSIRSN